MNVKGTTCSTALVIYQLQCRGKDEVQRATQQQLAHIVHFKISQQQTGLMLNVGFVWFTRSCEFDRTNHINCKKIENPVFVWI